MPGSPVDRNSSWTDPAPITFVTGVNAGTGQCDIPAGAVITSCTVTLTNPANLAGTAPLNLNHLQVTVAAGAAGATNRFDLIGAGLNIDFNALSGTPVNGTAVSVTLAGTALCGNTHSHTARVTVSVQICWTAVEDVFYQGTTGLQGTYLSHCMENLDCSATLPYVFADDGTLASGGFYSNSINGMYRTFCPNTSGQCVEATINYMDIEPYSLGWYDYMFVRDGPTQNSTILWGGAGTLAARDDGAGIWSNPFVATNESGCLSFTFNSDASISYGGWYITLACVPCAVHNPDTSSDCTQSIPTCGSTSFSGASTGPGLSSTCSGCLVAENFTTWYFFEIATSGTLSLTIDAVDNTNDYDLALFQASDCNSLGAPVRCSYAAINATGNTGLGNGAVDNSEDVTGDGWVAPINVTAGETYVLMINNWSPADMGYNLNFSLSGGATFDDCSNISLPVELIEFRGQCDEGDAQLFWSTASETNADYFAIMKSTDNTVFKTIGYVMAGGNSNTLRNYMFEDPEFTNGTAYYKLKTVDFDGTVNYSELLVLDCSGNLGLTDVRVSDHQDLGYTNVSFAGSENAAYVIQLMSVNGQVVFESHATGTGQMISQDIPTQELSAGIYAVSVRSGQSSFIRKLVIY